MSSPVPLKPITVLGVLPVPFECIFAIETGSKATEKTLWLRTKLMAVKNVTRNQDHGRGSVRYSDGVCDPWGEVVTLNDLAWLE